MLEQPCPHFGECGGCRTRDVPYPEQVARKEARLREVFAPFWSGAIPVTPSPVTMHYRNKVEVTFSLKHYPEPPPEGFVRDAVLGFKARGRWYCTLDIGNCLIGPEGMDGLLQATRDWMARSGLRPFNSRKREGSLRVLLVREGRRTGDRMVVLITTPGDFDKASFVSAVLSAWPGATSIQRGTFDGLADVASADELEVLHGTPTIDECLDVPDSSGAPRRLRFRISPFSFLQTNSAATELLYGHIRQWVQERAPRVLYDLYGGGGGIALSCSDLVEEIWSVENVASASEDGRHNARENGASNITFVTDRVKNYLKWRLQDGGLAPDSVAVFDPPRSGMVPKARRRIIEALPEHLLYVSCQPSVFVRELPEFLEAYQLDDLRAFDLFPHTEHVEAVASFTRR